MLIPIRKRTPEDLPGIARVVVDTWRSAYRGIVPDAVLDGLDYARNEARYRERLEKNYPAYAYVAADPQAGVVGMAAGGPAEKLLPGFPGELYAIYILPAYQGRGIGKRLVRAVFAQLEAARLSPAVIWALEQNTRAGAFYRALGGEVVGRRSIELGGLELPELGFGFKNLSWI